MRLSKIILAISLMACYWNSSAHTILISQYSLEYQERHWLLSYTHKTSILRDAILESRPDLRGINMNSEVFLAATHAYVQSNFSLIYRDGTLSFSPVEMHYNGLSFQATFAIEELPLKPNRISIQTSGFEFHEHAIHSLSITLGNQGYVQYFNRNQPAAVFDFTTKQYSDSIKQGGNKTTNNLPIYLTIVAGILLITGISTLRKRAK